MPRELSCTAISETARAIQGRKDDELWSVLWLKGDSHTAILDISLYLLSVQDFGWQVRCWSNLRSTTGVVDAPARPRSKTTMYDDMAVATTSFDESGEKMREDAPADGALSGS